MKLVCRRRPGVISVTRAEIHAKPDRIAFITLSSVRVYSQYFFMTSFSLKNLNVVAVMMLGTLRS